jgi:PAS domain S-box-containing protein
VIILKHTPDFFNINPQNPGLLEPSIYKFTKALLNAPVAMCVFMGPDHIMEMANEKMLELMGRTKEQVLGKPAFEGVPEASGQGFEQILDQVYTSLTSFSASEMPVKLFRKGSLETVYVNFVCEPFVSENGLTGITAVVLEVTEQVSSKMALADTAERLQLAMEGTSLATWDLDLVTQGIIYSPRLALIFGYDTSAILTHAQMRTQLHPGDRVNIVEKAFEKALATGQYDYEARIIRPDKTERWIKTQGKVIFDARKKPLRMLGTVRDITEQRLAEDSRNRLAAIVQFSDDAIIAKRLDGTVLSWNDAAQRIFGYSAEEMIGQSILRLIPPDRQHEEPEIILRLKSGQRIEHFETKRVTKDKRLIDISLTISPIKDQNGRIVGASKIARDISAQKHAERLIAENEDRLRIVVEASELGTWEMLLQSGEVSYSDRYLEILGYKNRTGINHDELRKHLHPDDLEIRDKAFEEAFKTGVLQYEARLVWNDQSIHWVEVKGKLLYDEKAQPLKLIGTIRDINEERLSQQRLAESEKRFRMVADTAPVLIWMSGTDKLCNYFNTAWLQFRGRTSEQEMGNGWAEGVHPDDLERCLDVYMNSFDRREKFYMEYRLQNHYGEYRWISDTGIPRYTLDGVFEGYIGACMDIHEQRDAKKELENRVEERTAELLEVNEELIRTNQELEQFAYVASHDLQEPLRKIQAFSEMLAADLTDNETSRHYLEKINSSAFRMSNLIRDLLSYSRLSKADERFQKTDLNEILQNIRNDFEVLVMQKNAVIESTPLPVINAIPVQINQLFYNLISNSLKFSDKNPIIQISARTLSAEEQKQVPGLEPGSKYIHLVFRDNGIGFSQAHASQIFVIFQRLNDKQKYGGTGIGLAMCKKIVENHHGHISARSEPEKGAAFDVYLPL